MAMANWSARPARPSLRRQVCKVRRPSPVCQISSGIGQRLAALRDEKQ